MDAEQLGAWGKVLLSHVGNQVQSPHQAKDVFMIYWQAMEVYEVDAEYYGLSVILA